MDLNPEEMSAGRLYATMTAAITPRPIAWISSISREGVPNLAPFSYFAGVGSAPPALMVSVVNRPDGSPKDTLLNIRATGEFVVNVVPYRLAQPMFVTSEEYAYGESEFEMAQLQQRPSIRVQPPAVAESPIQLECRLLQVVTVGEGPLAANAIFGQIVWIRISDAILDAQGHIDLQKVDTIGRLGGRSYSRINDQFELKSTAK